MRADALIEPFLWREADQFCVLDTDLGDGADFLNLLGAWTSDKGRRGLLHYIAVCGIFPNPPPKILSEHWPQFPSGFHSIYLAQERTRVTLIFEEAEVALAQISASCDVVLLKTRTLKCAELARLSRSGAVLKAGALDGSAKESLRRAGYSLTEDTGKISGIFKAKKTRRVNPGTAHHRREAVVIGAGLAGTAAAASLSRRGWNVTVLEQLSQAALGASGNRSAIFSPMISRDDGRSSRLSRTCFFSLLQELRCLDQTTFPAIWDACGVLQIARDASETRRFKEALISGRYPPEFVRYLEKDAAELDVGHGLSAGGLLFSMGGWIDPASLCRARLLQSGATVMTGKSVSRLENHSGIWEAIDSEGQSLASAPVMVCAQSFDALQLPHMTGMRFKKVRGQVTYFSESSLPRIGRVLNGGGYFTPSQGGVCSVGATYDFDSDQAEVTEASHHSNVGHLCFLLPKVKEGSLDPIGGRVGFRCLTADRLPVVGPLVDVGAPIKRGQSLLDLKRQAGLYGLLGLGSRGALWSTLAGEVLASQIENEPIPIPIDLLEAIDPGRFIFKASNGRPEGVASSKL